MSTPVWSKGRVALLGDAAFCNATFGGVGTSLALIGAYVLAGELSRTDDTRAALMRYERFMRRESHRRHPTRADGDAAASQSPYPARHPHAAHGSGIAASSRVSRDETFSKRAGRNATDDLRLPEYG